MKFHEITLGNVMRQQWLLKRLKPLSKPLLWMISVLLLMLLVMLLSSCTTTRIEYVQTPSVPIPAHLLNDCLPEYIPETFPWGDSLLINESLLTVIEQCNLDKKAIREIEEERIKK